MPRSVSHVDQSGRAPEVTVISIVPAGRRKVPPRHGSALGPREPVVVVAGNVHGDECTGVGVCLRLAEELEHTLTAGTVHLYPSLNPEGLERRTRRHPDEDVDLNRLFPGELHGSPAERLVYAVWYDISARRPDLVIDVHADAPGAIPYVLVDRAVALRGQERARLEAECHRLANASGLTVLQEYPDERYSRYRLDRSLTGAVLNRMQVPALTIEAGPRLVMDGPATHTVVHAVRGVLASLNMLAGAPTPHSTQLPGAWRRDSGPRAGAAGVLIAMVAPGDALKRGEVLAEVRSLGGAVLERVRAEGDGFVVSFVERAHVVSGVPVCTFGFAVG
ncbi:MAG: hypothetical protein EXR69_08570 [Myxococcales bacterium]|nr:hypothetical protein [Myxococcales bacterium]